MLWHLAALTGRFVRVVQPPRVDGTEGPAGSDLDCVVAERDEVWPLRLPPEYRLCGVLHQEPVSWTWVLAHPDGVLRVDVTDDPDGRGRYGVGTPELLGGPGPLAPPGPRAAYLTVKRVVKRDRDPARWEEIRRLAEQDWDGYAGALAAAVGFDAATAVRGSLSAGDPPDAGTADAIRRRLRLRRVWPPGAAVRLGLAEAARVVERLHRPTGLSVLVCGPDGTGKSTLAAALLRDCDGFFRRSRHVHWRPGVLPSPASLFGRPAGPADVSQPHLELPHPRGTSMALLGYYWLDFFIGGWMLHWPFRARTGLVVTERGWWDMAVDPRRYRLQVPPSVVRAMGRLLPSPDLAVVLTGDPDEILQRKAEIEPAELSRQLAAWKATPPPGRVVALDVAPPAAAVLAAAKEATIGFLESRALGRLGAGWVTLPPGRATRWWLPRGPRKTAGAAVRVHQPVNARGRAGWEAARLLAGAGGFRLLPRSQPPPRELRTALAGVLRPGDRLAVSRARAPGRYVSLVVGAEGTRAVAKVATTPEGAAALAHEAAAIRDLGPLLRPPISAPGVIEAHEGLLLLEPVRWRPRTRPWSLPEDVAFALGAFFRSGSAGAGGQSGAAHGDVAPWNLLRAGHGWALVDWESASRDGPPFFDVFHYLVQAHSLIGRPSAAAITEGLEGRGPIGAVLLAYARGANVDTADVPAQFEKYLRSTLGALVPDQPDRRAGIRARQALLHRPRG